MQTCRNQKSQQSFGGISALTSKMGKKPFYFIEYVPLITIGNLHQYNNMHLFIFDQFERLGQKSLKEFVGFLVHLKTPKIPFRGLLTFTTSPGLLISVKNLEVNIISQSLPAQVVSNYFKDLTCGQQASLACLLSIFIAVKHDFYFPIHFLIMSYM